MAGQQHNAGGAAPNGAPFDLIVVGAGSAGMPTALFAAERGARVLLLDHAPAIGGSLWVATGQMSAAGTRLQAERGIADSPQLHFDDVMRISRGTANPDLVRLAVTNAAQTFDWLLDQGFAPLPEHPVKGFGHEPYSVPRYYWGEKGALSIKDVLVPLVERAVAAGKITLRLEHEATGLLTSPDGAVTGVRARDRDGDEHEFSGRFVVLACGGYAANPALFEELNGYPQFNAGPYPYGRGAGLGLGQSVGGYVRGAENIFINFGTLFDTDEFPAKAIGRVEHFPERRQPWEIYVNVNGARFIREDIESVDAREMSLLQQPGYRYWIVFDQAILDRAPPIVVGWTREQMREAFARGGPAFLSAGSLDALAVCAGIGAQDLAAAVEGYNYGVRTGNDFLGRVHRPAPISTPPFYAIRMQASSISSALGLAVDAGLRVIRRDGSPVPNLYAAGELLGSSQTMGKAACGGMMVTPALTFGRLLGQHLIPLETRA
ncbi:MAG: FAD-dependent oxidoreductase [Rhizomicrobium sp.]